MYKSPGGVGVSGGEPVATVEGVPEGGSMVDVRGMDAGWMDTSTGILVHVLGVDLFDLVCCKI